MSTTYLGKLPSLNDTRVTRSTTREHVINMYYLSKSNYQTVSLTNFTLIPLMCGSLMRIPEKFEKTLKSTLSMTIVTEG